MAMVVGLVISGDGKSNFNIQQIRRHPVEREKHFRLQLYYSRKTALLRVGNLQKIRVFERPEGQPEGPEGRLVRPEGQPKGLAS